jgi:hypothetical protein
MKIFLLVVALFISGCESRALIETQERNEQLRIQAWQACIDAGGAPIEAWIGAPSMERCDYKEQGE